MEKNPSKSTKSSEARLRNVFSEESTNIKTSISTKKKCNVFGVDESKEGTTKLLI